MTAQNPTKKLSFPVVPISFILLILVGAFLYWWLRPHPPKGGPGNSPHLPVVYKPYQIPGGALHTNGFTKTEELHKDTDSWRGTTSTTVRLNATYRYEVPLRSDWRFFVDDTRKIAYVLAPPYRPITPVAVDTKSVEEYVSGGWGRFDKWDQLRDVQRDITAQLEAKAVSADYIALARNDARKTVEEFIGDWLLKSKDWRAEDQPMVKVYFQDDPGIVLPPQLKTNDFLPQ